MRFTGSGATSERRETRSPPAVSAKPTVNRTVMNGAARPPIRLVAAWDQEGRSTRTPVGSKSDTFSVTIVAPLDSAVAAIRRSAPSWPRRAESRPQMRASADPKGRMRSAKMLVVRSSHDLSSAAKVGSPASFSAMPYMH